MKLRRGPVAAKALAPTMQAPVHDEWSGDHSSEVSQEDIARLRLARGKNLYALTTEADLETLLHQMAEAGRLLVVDYYAPWCRACQRLLRQMQSLAMEDQYRDVSFASVDFEQSRDLCHAKNVEKLPTLEIYKGDELKQRWSGASKKRLLERLSDEMSALGETAEAEEKEEDEEQEEKELVSTSS